MPKLKVENGAVTIHYDLFGQGPEKVLFIMGFATNRSSWERQVDFFGNQHGDKYQVCIYDNRGMGDSDDVVGLYTTTRMAHDGKELLDHLNWDKYHLVGLSMGGMIAQELALLAPERLKSLCLCVTHSGGLHALPPVSGLWIMSQTVFSDMKTEAELLMKLQFSERFLSAKAANQGPETNKTNRDVLIEDFYLKRKKEGAPSMRGLIGQISAVSRHYISRERLRYLKQKLTEQNAPILLMTGTKDNLVKPINSFILKEILDVKLLVFEGAGHMIHIECESAFNQIVHRHISSPTTTVSSL